AQDAFGIHQRLGATEADDADARIATLRHTLGWLSIGGRLAHRRMAGGFRHHIVRSGITGGAQLRPWRLPWRGPSGHRGAGGTRKSAPKQAFGRFSARPLRPRGLMKNT